MPARSVTTPNPQANQSFRQAAPPQLSPSPGRHDQAINREGNSGVDLIQCSVMFRDSSLYPMLEAATQPLFFRDLHLDQIVDTIVRGKEEYKLRPYFYLPLRSTADIRYRQEVFRELEREPVAEACLRFSSTMRAIRGYLQVAEKSFHPQEKRRWFLDAVQGYCEGVVVLRSDLCALNLDSEGFRSVLRFLSQYIESEQFKALHRETQDLRSELDAISFLLYISGKRITVTRVHESTDYTAQVAADVEMFNQSSETVDRFRGETKGPLNQVEGAILDLVVQLYPDVFSAIEAFHSRYADSAIHPNVRLLEREVQFYLTCLDHVKRISAAGLSFCYPTLTEGLEKISATDAFDLALAEVLQTRREEIVSNDFSLIPPERIMVVTGPNQGGKTTFARTVGQMHHLARVGCPVPGSTATLLLCDEIFTLFEREEDVRTLTGKLEEELLRIHAILIAATAKSLLITNESFAATAAADAVFLLKKIMKQVLEKKMLCVTVTFLDELAEFNKAIVSMVTAVDPGDPSRRTFKVNRQSADGKAYAMAIAEKYRLTENAVAQRIAKNSAGR